MQEKYFAIAPEKAKELLSQAKEMKPAKRGIDRHAYLIDEYAVLSTNRLKLRNVITRDDDLAYFDEIIETLLHLQQQSVAVVPILGYCFDPDSENGNGYIIQQRAKGEELYDDAVMSKYYAHTFAYLSSNVDAKEYILTRTSFIANAPQQHFDKFIRDIIILGNHNILIDFMGKSNFFYDDIAGFQFIDLDSHTDYRYGLIDHKYDSKEIAVIGGFAPCHFATGTKAFANIALNKKAIKKIGKQKLQQLAQDNQIIFEKCKIAMLHNGITQEQMNHSFETLKIFGC